MLFFFLYFGIVSEKVKDETSGLLIRGISHRDVLEKKLDSVTVRHVALMESEAEADVIITDENLKVIDSSNEISSKQYQIMKNSKAIEFSHHGLILEARWKTEPYIVTVNPININNTLEGYVFMFLPTGTIRNMVNELTYYFLFMGFISIIFTFITIFFLSKFITAPLLEMKRATQELSKGDHQVQLYVNRDDELGELAKAIQLLADELKHLKQTRNEFLSSISHELRTPLTYIKGYADIVNKKSITNEQRYEYMKIIQEEASRVALLVKDLFELAKMDENEFKIQKEAVSLQSYLEQLVTKFRPAYESQAVQLILDFPKKDIEVSIDPTRFGQVIHNLLDNALKHSGTNTSVTLSVNYSDSQVSIIINDEGEGIPHDEVHHIWERLYRVEKSRSRATGGSGLGLAIVKKIIEKHDAIISVDSKLGEGTTFTIELKR
ncbi:HAMP domain-containing sensor histidine kinase [Bacillus salinus]|uniref:HAMP domain-containing sensor histidine kinase n=1 Tax=Bacillus sp. HMF5848 TaxID=2495421 RepID=UPI0021AD7764|nr:HAMP domain-containing sensor histidine kinase [Bacillus sp. HMF5848]